MSNAFIGQITMFAGNFPPKNTAFCNGQILGIAQNQALFAVLGTTYGGNGQTTFALPNLQSQVPIHQGQGPGLSPYTIGQTGGTPSVALDQTTMPIHLHTLSATQTIADSATIANNKLPAQPTAGTPPAFYAFQGASPLPPLTKVAMNPAACSTVGGSAAHNNLMPSLCVSFVIFLRGIFPSRN
jgi:microcystin-dependent protein